MIYLASDHGGFSVKEQVKRYLKHQEIEYKDLGPHILDHNDDYPDYILPLAEMIAKHQGYGIISCRNGQGAAIAANKVPGVRAAVCWNVQCARTARNDDNANVLSLPADYLSALEVDEIVATWLMTPFSHDARHLRRLAKIEDYEKEPRRSTRTKK